MKKLRSVTRKGKSKTKDVSVKDDNVKDFFLKDEEGRKVGGDKSKGEKSVAEKSESGNGVEGTRGETVVKKNIAEEENEENVKTPMKRKRGADGKIVQAFISSPGKGSSRLRLRKEVAAFRMIELSENDGENIVGKRVKVYWSGSRRWFLGCIKAFDNEKRLHKIYYDDGDKEELDLRQERFELEVMPGDNFTLKTESKSKKKVKGSDGGKVSAEGLKEESVREEASAELVEKHSWPKKNKAAKKAFKRGSSKSERTKDAEDKKAEDLITEMDVNVLPENFDKVQTDEVRVVEEPSDAGAEKDHDASKSILEKAIETTEPSVSLATRLESISETKEMGSNGGDKSRKTVKDNSVKGGDAEPGKTYVKLKKKATPRTPKMMGSKLQSRKESKEEEKLAPNMEVDAHRDEDKTSTMHAEINLKDSLDLDYPKENDETESLAKEASPESCGMSHDAHAGQPNFNSEKKELGFEGSKVSGETGEGECSSPQGVKDNMENLAADVEVDVNPEKVEEKVIGGDINVEGPGDVSSVKNNDETKSFSQVVSEGTCEVSLDLQPIKPKSLEEEDPEILQGKLKSESNESAVDRPKEQLKKESISEGMMKTNTQGLEQPDDNHSGNDLNLVDLASQKNPVRRARSKVQKK